MLAETSTWAAILLIAAGAAITTALSLITEAVRHGREREVRREQQQREDKRRFDDELRLACQQYIHAADRWWHTAIYTEKPASANPMEDAKITINFTAPREVRAAATAMNTGLAERAWQWRSAVPHKGETREALLHGFEAERHRLKMEFVDAVRRHLGVDSDLT